MDIDDLQALLEHICRFYIIYICIEMVAGYALHNLRMGLSIRLCK